VKSVSIDRHSGLSAAIAYRNLNNASLQGDQKEVNIGCIATPSAKPKLVTDLVTHAAAGGGYQTDSKGDMFRGAQPQKAQRAVTNLVIENE
jgi:hypothetical protein